MALNASIALPCVALALLTSAATRAYEIPCGPVEKEVITLDGLLGDWRGVEPVRVEGPSRVVRGLKRWHGGEDLSCWIKCNYDHEKLYLAVRVRDQRVAFNAHGQRGDHIELRFGTRTLSLFPSDLKRVKQRLLWGTRPARGIEAAEALQLDGYSVELALPLGELPGFRRGAPGLRLALAVCDADSRSGEPETLLSSGPATLVFAQARADIEAFLEAVNAKGKPIRVRRTGDVCGDPQIEQVLLVGRTLGIVGHGTPEGGYYYVDLPARSAEDVRWIRLVDLNGDGKKEIVVRYAEHAANGRREIVEIYRFNLANKLSRPFAHEVLKGQDERVLTNRVRFVSRRGGRGVDLVIDRPTAKGFSADTYRELRSASIYPILLPWEGPQQEAFRFEGDTFSAVRSGEAAQESKARRKR